VLSYLHGTLFIQAHIGTQEESANYLCIIDEDSVGLLFFSLILLSDFLPSRPIAFASRLLIIL